MSVALAGAAIAAASAAQASAAAHQAMIDRCRVEIAGYDSHSATVQEMQSYAGCVNAVYPQPQDDGGMRVVIFLLLLSAVIGTVVGFYSERENVDRIERNFTALLGTLFGVIAFVAIFLIFQAIKFVIFG